MTADAPRATPATTRALVLGGGLAGIAWEVGVLDPPAAGPFRSVTQEIEHRRQRHPDLAADHAVAVLADEASVAAFGSNVLDPASMPASARAGRGQGRAAAGEVARRWV